MAGSIRLLRSGNLHHNHDNLFTLSQMTTNEQLEQARIAVQILETEAKGEPVEWEINPHEEFPDTEWRTPIQSKSALMYAADGYGIRIKPFTPAIPEGFEEVPESEKDGQWKNGWKFYDHQLREWRFYSEQYDGKDGCYACNDRTIRTIRPIKHYEVRKAFECGEKVECLHKLSSDNWFTISPDEPPPQWNNEECEFRIHDPYRHLKEAQAEGKMIQIFVGDSRQNWEDWLKPDWTAPPKDYRIKPTKTLVPWSLADHPSGCVWVKPKTNDGQQYLITKWDKWGGKSASDMMASYEGFLSDFTLLDGSPCGNVKEVVS